MKSPKLEALANELSLSEIKDLLRKKEKDSVRLEKLQVKRKSLLSQIQEIEAEMKKLEGEGDTGKLKAAKKPARKGRKSRKGGKTIRECAVEYLSSVGKKARLGDIVSYVVKQRKGEIKPTATDWTGVSTVLRKEKSVKRVGKGLYRLVGGKAPESEARKKPIRKTRKKPIRKAAKKDATKTVKKTGKQISKPRTATKPDETSGSK